MRGEFLPFAAPLLGDEEIDEVVHCLRSGWLTTGLKVKQFEREFAEFCGVPHALAVNSCTAALHLALEAIGIGPGDEVITTPMTFTATAAVIEHLGARPVFADVDPRTLNIDPAAIAPRVTERTKAILPVHFAGQACGMAGIPPRALRRPGPRHGRHPRAGARPRPARRGGRGARDPHTVQGSSRRNALGHHVLQLLRDEEPHHG